MGHVNDTIGRNNRYGDFSTAGTTYMTTTKMAGGKPYGGFTNNHYDYPSDKYEPVQRDYGVEPNSRDSATSKADGGDKVVGYNNIFASLLRTTTL